MEKDVILSKKGQYIYLPLVCILLLASPIVQSQRSSSGFDESPTGPSRSVLFDSSRGGNVRGVNDKEASINQRAIEIKKNPQVIRRLNLKNQTSSNRGVVNKRASAQDRLDKIVEDLIARYQKMKLDQIDRELKRQSLSVRRHPEMLKFLKSKEKSPRAVAIHKSSSREDKETTQSNKRKISAAKKEEIKKMFLQGNGNNSPSNINSVNSNKAKTSTKDESGGQKVNASLATPTTQSTTSGIDSDADKPKNSISGSIKQDTTGNYAVGSSAKLTASSDENSGSKPQGTQGQFAPQDVGPANTNNIVMQLVDNNKVTEVGLNIDQLAQSLNLMDTDSVMAVCKGYMAKRTETKKFSACCDILGAKIKKELADSHAKLDVTREQHQNLGFALLVGEKKIKKYRNLLANNSFVVSNGKSSVISNFKRMAKLAEITRQIYGNGEYQKLQSKISSMWGSSNLSGQYQKVQEKLIANIDAALAHSQKNVPDQADSKNKSIQSLLKVQRDWQHMCVE